MNKILFRLIGVIAVAIYSVSAYAETFEVDGIYYKTDWSDNTIAIVTYNEDLYLNDDSYYKGNISIPATVTHNGKQYRVTTIGSMAFSFCEELESVTLPEGLLIIEDMAFSNSGIFEITLPASLTSLSSSAFQSCNNLKSIHVVDSNTNFCEVDGVLYDKAKETLICYPSGKGKSYVVPTNTKKIGKEAFAGSQIANITLNEGLACIDDAAFGSTELKCITIPSSVTQFGKFIFEFSNPKYIITNILEPQNISESTFEYAEYDSENEIYNNTVLYVPLGTKSKYKSATGWKSFVSIRECDRIEVDGFEYEVTHNTYLATLLKKSTSVSYKEEIEIPENVSYKEQLISVVGIAEDAFKGTSLGNVVIGKNVQSIGNNAFYGCSNLKKIVVRNETPIAIDESVFYGVYDKATLFVPQGFLAQYQQAEVWKKFSTIQEEQTGDIETEGGFRVGGIYYEIDTATPINVRVVKNPDGYKGAITIPSQVIFKEITYRVTEIGKAAFESSKIESIAVSEGVTTINDNAFFLCGNLNHVTLPSTLTTIGNNAFRSTAIKEIDIPILVTTIGKYAFSSSALTSITIPKNVVEIGVAAFSSCKNLATINVNPGNIVYDSRENCNAIIKDAVIIAGCTGTTAIPTSVTEIGESAFEGAVLKNISLPLSLKIIGKSAFESSKIESIDIPEGVTTISNNTFFLCGNLSHVTLPSTLTTIGNNAFRSTAIKEIDIPSSVVSIGTYAFDNCKKFVGLVIKHTEPLQIDNNLFSGLYDMVTLYVPIGTEDLYRQADGWKNFANIQAIEPDPTPIIDSKTFVIHKRTGLADIQSVASDEHIVVPETIEYEGKSYTVTRILDSALEGSNMISLSIPSSVISIGQNAIKDCNQLAAIEWNPKFKPSTEFVGHIDNINLLFYVTEEQYKPDDIRNVIVGDQASSITLTDEAHGNFYCPRAFTASNITYTHNYSLPTEKGLAQGWESIVLPFDVTTIKIASGDVIKPVTIAEDGVKRFWLKELSVTGLKETSQIKANVPYIISMPNWDGYQDFYNITGDVTFSAQNATIGVTENNTVTSGINNLTSTYQNITKQNEFCALNLTETVYEGKTYAPGSAFIPGLRDIRPFEAYFTKSSAASARKVISIADLMDGATAIADIPVRGDRVFSDNGIIYIESVHNGNCNIYSMSGQLMRKVVLKKGTNTVNGLSKGIYLVNGNKVLVK